MSEEMNDLLKRIQDFMGVERTDGEIKPAMRKEVIWFSQLMQKRLEDNAYQDALGWHDLTTSDLVRQIQLNITDIQIADLDDNPEELFKHSADIANYAMMIADNVRGETK